MIRRVGDARPNVLQRPCAAAYGEEQPVALWFAGPGSAVCITQLGQNENVLRPRGRSYWFHPDRSRARHL